MEISAGTDRHKDEEQDRRGKDSHSSWGKKEVMLFRDLKRLVIEAAQVWLRNTSSTRDASVFICGADETETWTPATTVMIGELIRVEELLVRTKSPSSERIKAEILLPGIKTQTIYTHTHTTGDQWIRANHLLGPSLLLYILWSFPLWPARKSINTTKTSLPPGTRICL